MSQSLIQRGQWVRPGAAPRPFPAGAGESPAAGAGVPATELVRGLTSIVILAHDGFALSRRCVESVLRHTSRAYELILVDNGSRDGTGRYFAAVAAERRHVRAIRLERNHGVYARTFGMYVARGEYICWLDNDVEVGEGWLDPLVAAMADPAVGGAGAEGVALTPDWQHRFHTQGWPPERAAGQRVDILVGYCFLFRNLVRYIGYLDPQFNPFWNEEADYSFRIKLLGYRLVVAPTNVVHHRHGTGLRLLPDRDAHIARMNQALIAKWEPFKHLFLECYRDL